MMSTAAKARSKGTIRPRISTDRVTEGISVLDTRKRGYLTFRAELDERVSISASAMVPLLKDLHRHRETMGFLLGYNSEKGVSFVRYAPARMHMEKRRNRVGYTKKGYLKELRRFRRQGYDAQADLHNHPYEDDRKISIRRSMRWHAAPWLLRHGLFAKLEKRGRLSKSDRETAKRDHHALGKKGVRYQRNFSGVLSTFYVKHLDASVKVLMLHGENGKLKHPVGIELRETGE